MMKNCMYCTCIYMCVCVCVCVPLPSILFQNHPITINTPSYITILGPWLCSQVSDRQESKDVKLTCRWRWWQKWVTNSSGMAALGKNLGNIRKSWWICLMITGKNLGGMGSLFSDKPNIFKKSLGTRCSWPLQELGRSLYKPRSAVWPPWWNHPESGGSNDHMYGKS